MREDGLPQRILDWAINHAEPFTTKDLEPVFVTTQPKHIIHVVSKLKRKGCLKVVKARYRRDERTIYQFVKQADRRSRRQRMVDAIAGKTMTLEDVREYFDPSERINLAAELRELARRGDIIRVAYGVYTAEVGTQLRSMKKAMAERVIIQHSEGRRHNPDRVTVTQADAAKMKKTAKRLRVENENRKSDPITPRRQVYSAQCQQRVVFRGEEKTCAGIENEPGNPLCPPCQDRAFTPHGFSDTSQGKWTGEKVEMI